MRNAARRYVALRSALNKLFEEWDPLGVYAGEDEWPSGEYDDLAEMTIVGLRSGTTGAPLREVIEAVLLHRYGMSDVHVPRPLAERIEEHWLAWRPVP